MLDSPRPELPGPPCGPTGPLAFMAAARSSGGMFLKRRVRQKDGKEHVHSALCESLRVQTGRGVQRQVLHLGELNPTQTASGQRTLEIIHEADGARLPRRLFTDRDGAMPTGADDGVEVRRSSLRVRAPRRFGDG